MAKILINDNGKALLSSQGKAYAVTNVDRAAGASPLTVTAAAGKVLRLYRTGKCTQAGTPTPSAPVDIVCNNGALAVRRESGLQPGYTLVESVRNAASTVATTSIKDDVDDMEYEIRVKPNSGSWYILQSRAASNSYIYGISGSSSGNTITFLYGLPTGLTSGIGARNPDHIYFVRASHKNGVATLYVKDETTGEEDTQTTTYNTADFTPSTVNLRFWGNSQNTINANNNIYHAKIRKSGELVLDTLPVTYGGEAGLYDFAGATFLAASQGTLYAGNPVADPVEVYVDGTPEVVMVAPDGAPTQDQEGASTQSGTPTPSSPVLIVDTPFGNTVLRGIGDYKDSYDVDTNTITRRVGVIVFDGTEAWSKLAQYNVFFYHDELIRYNNPVFAGLSSHFVGSAESNANMPDNSVKLTYVSGYDPGHGAISFKHNASANADAFKAFLAAQYEAGIPVIAYYPLATPTTEVYTGPHISRASVPDLLALTDYVDEADIISGKVTRRCGILVLDGTESWTKAASYNVYSTPVGEARSVSERYFALSTHFVSTNETNANMPADSIKATDLSSAYAVSIKSATISTLENWKAYLAAQYANGTPVIVVYPLSAPTTEQVTPQELTTAAGANIITAAGDIDLTYKI